MKRKGLNKQQRDFLTEYIKNNFKNAGECYAKFYKVKSKETAETNASRLLSNAKFREHLDMAKEKALEKNEITEEWIVKNIVEVIEKCKGIEIKDPESGEIQKIEGFDSRGQLKGLELLGKWKSLFTDKVEHSGNLSLIELAKKTKEERDGKI